MYTAWHLRHYLEHDKPRLNTLFHIDLDSHCREQIYQVRKIIFFFNIQTGIMTMLCSETWKQESHGNTQRKVISLSPDAWL